MSQAYALARKLRIHVNAVADIDEHALAFMIEHETVTEADVKSALQTLNRLVEHEFGQNVATDYKNA